MGKFISLNEVAVGDMFLARVRENAKKIPYKPVRIINKTVYENNNGHNRVDVEVVLTGAVMPLFVNEIDGEYVFADSFPQPSLKDIPATYFKQELKKLATQKAAIEQLEEKIKEIM